jgi:hypothetical protein
MRGGKDKPDQNHFMAQSHRGLSTYSLATCLVEFVQREGYVPFHKYIVAFVIYISLFVVGVKCIW